MNLQHERLMALSQTLRLEGIAAQWSALAQKAANEEASFADYLECLYHQRLKAGIDSGCILTGRPIQETVSIQSLLSAWVNLRDQVTQQSSHIRALLL
jgi:DNA replication protein DnaC